MHEKSLIWCEKHQISGLVYLGWVDLVLDRSKTVRDVFVVKIKTYLLGRRFGVGFHGFWWKNH